MLVQLLLIYYGASQWAWMRAAWEAGHPLWTWFREPYFCALLAFGLNTCAYTVEILAGSMRNTPHGELEAARAMGMSRMKALQRIVIPSALRRMIPSYSNEVILMLQGSAIASAVTLVDLTGAARNVYSRHFAPFEVFRLRRPALPRADLHARGPVQARRTALARAPGATQGRPGQASMIDSTVTAVRACGRSPYSQRPRA